MRCRALLVPCHPMPVTTLAARLAGRDTKSCVATPKGSTLSQHRFHVATRGLPTMSRPGHDTKQWVAKPKGHNLSRHQNDVVTPNGQTRSRHQKLCHDTEMPDPCRGTKNYVATDLSPPCTFRVATPQWLPLSLPRTTLVPTSAMSRHKN